MLRCKECIKCPHAFFRYPKNLSTLLLMMRSYICIVINLKKVYYIRDEYLKKV